MNKKLKLILSCFCLCLTLGIMSVAVWAATTTNYTLSNTISYQIEDVYVRVQTKLYKKSTAGMVSGEDLISQCEALEGKKHSEITGVTLVETYDEFKTYDGKSAINPSTTGCNCDIAYDTSAQNPAFAYYVVMEIENYASDPIHAYLLNNTTKDLNSYVYFTSNLVELEGKSTISVVIGFALKDSTIALSETSAPFDLKINEGEYNPEDYITFTEVSGGYSVKAKNTSIAGPLVIPETYNNLSVTSIEEYAFRGCSQLTSAIIPSSIASISGSAFYACSKLIDITISSGVTSIKDHAFFACTSLTDVTIPNSVNIIEGYVFRFCYSLKSLLIEGATATNWSYANSSTATEWTQIDLTNPETNSAYFKDTYDSMYFKK